MTAPANAQNDLNPVKLSQNSKEIGLKVSEGIQLKLEEIEKVVSTPVLMLGMTGYSDYREMAQALFSILAHLEMVDQAYMNTNRLAN